VICGFFEHGMKPLITLAALLVACTASAGELEEVARLAPRFGSEVKLEARQWDETRVDLLTPTHAIEADYPRKWAEAIGQSLYYAELTGRKPGILLLVADPKAERSFIYRCQTVCAKHGITLWIGRIELAETPTNP
jgi:hypothetical protein